MTDPPAEPSHRRPLAVVRLPLDHEQGDGEFVLEVDGGKLGGGRLDEREVAAVEGVAQPPVMGLSKSPLNDDGRPEERPSTTLISP